VFTDRDDVEPHQVHTASVRPTLLIVDDHDGFRAVARALLEGDRFEVVGEASDGASAVAQSRRLVPRVVLLDVHLPDRDGFEVCATLDKLDPSPSVVLISSRPIADLRRRLRGSPAKGFVSKDELSLESLTGILNQ
jgi:DNA-binding NarL/FixJ family response regulator